MTFNKQTTNKRVFSFVLVVKLLTCMYTQNFSNGCRELPFSKIEGQNIVKIFLIEFVCIKIKVYQVLKPFSNFLYNAIYWCKSKDFNGFYCIIYCIVITLSFEVFLTAKCLLVRNFQQTLSS